MTADPALPQDAPQPDTRETMDQELIERAIKALRFGAAAFSASADNDGYSCAVELPIRDAKHLADLLARWPALAPSEPSDVAGLREELSLYIRNSVSADEAADAILARWPALSGHVPSPAPEADKSGFSFPGGHVTGDKASIDAVVAMFHAKERCEALDRMITNKELVRPAPEAGYARGYAQCREDAARLADAVYDKAQAEKGQALWASERAREYEAWAVIDAVGQICDAIRALPSDPVETRREDGGGVRRRAIKCVADAWSEGAHGPFGYRKARTAVDALFACNLLRSDAND